MKVEITKPGISFPNHLAYQLHSSFRDEDSKAGGGEVIFFGANFIFKGIK